MEVSDEKVFETMQKVASMEPAVRRVTEFFDNGILDKKIQKAVTDGIKSCPFYIEGKVRRKTNTAVRWILTLCVPILVTILTLFASGVFAK